MRKLLNWYPISVIVILLLGVSIHLGGEPLMSEGEVFLRFFLEILLIAALVILSIVKVITRERTFKLTNAAIFSGVIGSLITIVIAGIDFFVIPVFCFTVPISALMGVVIYRYFVQIGTDWEKIREHKKVAFLSAISGVSVLLIAVIYFNFNPTLNGWYGPRVPKYGSVVDFPARNTVKLLSPSGNVFLISYLNFNLLGSCKDDNCLRAWDGRLDNPSDNIYLEGAKERGNFCYPIISPPEPPVIIASEVAIFRDCQPVNVGIKQVLVNMRETRRFLDESGNIYSWSKDYEEAYSNALSAFMISSLVFIPIFGFLGVTIYQRYVKFRE